jgi:hypothetical protein
VSVAEPAKIIKRCLRIINADCARVELPQDGKNTWASFERPGAIALPAVRFFAWPFVTCQSSLLSSLILRLTFGRTSSHDGVPAVFDAAKLSLL